MDLTIYLGVVPLEGVYGPVYVFMKWYCGRMNEKRSYTCPIVVARPNVPNTDMVHDKIIYKGRCSGNLLIPFRLQSLQPLFFRRRRALLTNLLRRRLLIRPTRPNTLINRQRIRTTNPSLLLNIRLAHPIRRPNLVNAQVKRPLNTIRQTNSNTLHPRSKQTRLRLHHVSMIRPDKGVEWQHDSLPPRRTGSGGARRRGDDS